MAKTLAYALVLVENLLSLAKWFVHARALAIGVDCLEGIALVRAFTTAGVRVELLGRGCTCRVDTPACLFALDFWGNAHAIAAVVVAVGARWGDRGALLALWANGIAWFQCEASSAPVIGGAAERSDHALVQ